MKLSNVLWAERRVIENKVKVRGCGRNWEMLMKEKLQRKQGAAFLRYSHLLERSQEERQGEK